MKRLITLSLALLFSAPLMAQSELSSRAISAILERPDLPPEEALGVSDLNQLGARLAAQDSFFLSKRECLIEIGRVLVRIIPAETWVKELERIYWAIPKNCTPGSQELYRSASVTTAPAPNYSNLYIYSAPDGKTIYTNRKPSDGTPYRVIPYQTRNESLLHNMWRIRGYPCTSDCSGHDAGYAWARENNIDDRLHCTGSSKSFIEGCYAYVEENN